MKLETEKGEYNVHFRHHNISKRRTRKHYVTIAHLHAGPCKYEDILRDGKPVLDKKGRKKQRCVVGFLEGRAQCHSKLDKFDPNEGCSRALDAAMLYRPYVKEPDGRKRLLERATWTEHVPQATRKQIWDSYKAQAKLPTSHRSELAVGAR